MEDPSSTPWRDVALREGNIRSSASFPLIARGNTFGALNLYSSEIGFFTEERVTEIQAFANLAAVALENARLYEESLYRIQRITALRNIDMAITGSLDLRVITRVALDEIVKELNVDASSILILDPYTQTLEYLDAKGFKTEGIKKMRIPLGAGLSGKVASERRLIHIPDLSSSEDHIFLKHSLIRDEGFISYYGLPLIAKGKVLGVLEIFNRTPHEGNSEWIDFLEALAGQVAMALENANLVDDILHKHEELLRAYNETIEGWGMALSLKEEETSEHSKRVTVLLKPGKLTEDEWKIMKKHPEYAYKMLSPISYLRRALEIPYSHHERWDGTGYPRGLKGKEIPLSARIFAVVDVWDALTRDRPYRKAYPEDKVIEYIRSESGSHFDPEVVEVFLRILREDSH
jgi:GAF domain-containing protein